MASSASTIQLTPDEIRGLFRHYSEQRRNGAPLSWINADLKDVTGGQAQSMMQLARLMEMVGNEEDRTELRQVGVVEGVARAATRGLTLGLAPAIAGAVYGPETARLERIRQLGFESQRPVLSTVAEMFGAAVPSVAGGAAALAARTMGGKLLASALAGGVEGAVYGGATEGTTGAVMQGALGAALGPASASVSPVTRRLFGNPAMLARESGTQIAENVGLTRATAGTIAGDMAEMNRTLMRAGASPVARPADTHMGQRILGTTIRHSGTAAELAADRLEARAVEAPRVLEGILRDAWGRSRGFAEPAGGGVRRASTKQIDRALKEEQRAVARVVYGPLDALRPTDPADAMLVIGDLQSSPSFRAIWRRAQTTAAEEGRRLVDLPASVDDILDNPDRMPDFRTFQAIRSQMREDAVRLMAAGRGQAGRALRARAEHLSEHIQRLFPDVVEADRQYRTAELRRHGAILGSRMWNEGVDPNDIRDFLATAPAEAQESLREAGHHALRTKTLSVGRGRNPVARVIDAGGVLGREKMALVFSPDELSLLDDATETMRRLWRTSGTVMGNSPTRARQAVDEVSGLRHPQMVPATSRWAVARLVADPIVHAEYQNRLTRGAPWLTRGLLSEGAEQAQFLAELQQPRVLWPADPGAALPFITTGLGRTALEPTTQVVGQTIADLRQAASSMISQWEHRSVPR